MARLRCRAFAAPAYSSVRAKRFRAAKRRNGSVDRAVALRVWPDAPWRHDSARLAAAFLRCSELVAHVRAAHGARAARRLAALLLGLHLLVRAPDPRELLLVVEVEVAFREREQPDDAPRTPRDLGLVVVRAQPRFETRQRTTVVGRRRRRDVRALVVQRALDDPGADHRREPAVPEDA